MVINMFKSIHPTEILVTFGIIITIGTFTIAFKDFEESNNKTYPYSKEDVMICSVKYEKRYSEIGTIEYHPVEYCGGKDE